MGILDFFLRPKDKTEPDMTASAFNGAERSEQVSGVPTQSIKDMPYINEWAGRSKLGIPRRMNIVETRQFGREPTVQMVINAIIKRFCDTPFVIRPKDDGVDVEKCAADIKKSYDFFDKPGINGETFAEIFGPYLYDILQIDAGVIYKVRNKLGKVMGLATYDGSRFWIDVDPHGIIRGYYQYSLLNPVARPEPFSKEDIVYGQVNRRPELFPYGFSPLQSIQQVVENLIQSTRDNAQMFKNGMIPDGLVTVEMEKGELLEFQTGWKQTFQGKRHKLGFLNKPVSFTDLRKNNRDMQWLEGQKLYQNIVFSSYGMSPPELGINENANRASSESGERTSDRNAIKPYLSHVARKITNEILPEVVGHEDLIFEFEQDDTSAQKIEHAQNMDRVDRNILTINEVRAMYGLESVEWGDEPPKSVSFQTVPQNEERNEDEGTPVNEETPEKSQDDYKTRLYEYAVKNDVV